MRHVILTAVPFQRKCEQVSICSIVSVVMVSPMLLTVNTGQASFLLGSTEFAILFPCFHPVLVPVSRSKRRALGATGKDPVGSRRQRAEVGMFERGIYLWALVVMYVCARPNMVTMSATRPDAPIVASR